MNDQERNELRVKVAECARWLVVDCGGNKMCVIRHGDGPVDPLHDLNACHEFEKTLGDLQLQLYVEELVGKKWHEPWSVEDAMGLVVATATQRCQAFVKLHES